MKKRFFAFLIFVMSLVLVTSCDINKKKEKLEVPTNVAVSEEGLVTWDEVKNADAYFVEINEENKKYNTTVYECQYQLENLNNDCTITVVAKGDKYTDSDKSVAISYVGANTKKQEVLYKDLVESTLGEKSEDLTPEDAVAYDKAAAYLKKAAKNVVALGYNEETIQTIVTSISNAGSDPTAIATALVTILSTYNTEDIKMALYYGEIKLIGALYSARSEISGNENAETGVALIDKVLEVLESKDLETVEHLCNILAVVKDLSKDVELKVMPLVTVLMQEVQSGNITANTIYRLKNAAVGVLGAHLVDVEDVQYFFDLATSVSNELQAVFEAQLVNASGTAKMVFEVMIEILPQLPNVDITEVYAKGQETYLAVLKAIEGISEEFIEEVLRYEDPIQMVVYAVAALVPQYLPETFEIPVEFADVVVAFANKAISELIKLEGSEVTIETLIGLTEEEVKSVLVSAINLVNSLGTAVIDVAKNPEFAKIAAELTKIKINNSASISYSQIAPNQTFNDYYFQEVMKKYEITSGDGFEYHVAYELYLDEVVTDTKVSCTYVEIYIADVIRDENNTILYYEYKLTIKEMLFENLQNLLPLVALFEGKLDTTTTNLTALVNALLAVVGKVQLNEALASTEVGQQIASILAIVSQLKVGDVDALLGNVYELVGMLVKYVSTLNINELAYTIAKGDTDQLTLLLAGFASQESVAVAHELVVNAGDVLEKLNMLSAMGFETKEDFVAQITAIVDYLLPLPEQTKE